jgi:hypothetical protein
MLARQMTFWKGIFADSTFLVGLGLLAIGDVVSVFFDLVGLLIRKFFAHLWAR